jgi:hypothetical protein
VGVQSWWGNLLQGGISAIIGGLVAALTAWAVVAATRRHERRSALEIEARRAAIDFFFILTHVSGNLENALEQGKLIPMITEEPEWGIGAIRTEIAMFSVRHEIGSKFSQLVGNLRRSLEVIENHTDPDIKLIQSAIEANQKLIDYLADWLMEGRHHESGAA